MQHSLDTTRKDPWPLVSTGDRAATYDDAHLLLRLHELRREEKMRTASNRSMKNFRAGTLDDSRIFARSGQKERHQ